MNASDGMHAARSLGRDGPPMFPIGLGCMAMSGMYGASDEAESIATIHAALDRGVNCSTPAISTAWATTSS